jgi:hypothetical protein
MTRFLVQLTAMVNQKLLWYTRVPYNTTLLMAQNLISHVPTSKGGVFHTKGYGDSGPDSIPDSPWISSTSYSLSGPGMTGSGGGAAIASS